MSESVLVIPSPSSCFDCPLFREGIVDTCLPLDRDIHDEEGGFDENGGRPSWCPLRPLPSKLVPFGYLDAGNEDGLYEKGYNDCIDEITGETE